MLAETQMNAPAANAPSRAAAPQLRVAPAVKQPVIAADKVKITTKKAEPAKAERKGEAKPRPVPSPVAKVPGEDVRNSVSVVGVVLGPLVSAKQILGVLSTATFNNPLLKTFSKVIVNAASALSSKVPLLRSPAVGKTTQWINDKLPWLGAGLFAFDTFAFIKTLTNKEASSTRKWLTAGRFVFNGIATALSFNKSAGMLISMPFTLIGNGFEIAMARLNTKEAQQAAQQAAQ